MDFQQASTYLLSLGNEVTTMKLGLENIGKLLAALGDPQNNYLKVQVAGTNGKGSVCAFLNSICVKAGIKTGMFTSPHLISMTERVQINGEDISEDEFARLSTRVRSVSEDLVAAGELESVPTYFEQVTAIGLLAFAEAKVELAILETGLGGRLDATTAANAQIAAITRIDLDHQQYLGETIEEIAAEKAAIIHEGSLVVVGEQSPEAMAVILERCRVFDITPQLALSFEKGGNLTGREGLSLPPLGLAGRHQVENAKVAIGVVEFLRERFSISDSDVRDGLKTARHPGRLESHGRFLFDGAHNIGGAKALRSFLDEFVHEPITMVFGSMNDKDVSDVTTILFPKANMLILTRSENSRAMSADELTAFVPDHFDSSAVFTTDTALDALEKALEVSTGNCPILVTGSLYLVGEVRRLLPKKLKS